MGLDVSDVGEKADFPRERSPGVAEDLGASCPEHCDDAEFAKLLEKVRDMLPPKLNVNLNDTRYAVVKECCKELRWKDTGCKGVWSMSWLDCGGITAETSIGELNTLQKINHLPGMSKICQKCKLALTFNRLHKEFPDLYDFHPQSFCLPKEKSSLKRWWQLQFVQEKRRPVMIAKPDGGCQGQGIFLVNDFKELEAQLPTDNSPVAVQEYVKNPYTIRGHKFDLRIYVLVTSSAPKLRAFLHREGLVRFATERYHKPTKENLKKRYMHLTNYSVNKNNIKIPARDGTVTDVTPSDQDVIKQIFNASKLEELGKRQYEKSIDSNRSNSSELSRSSSSSSSSSDGGYDSTTNDISKPKKPVSQKQQGENQDEEHDESGEFTDTKWDLARFYRYLSRQGHDVEALKAEIQNVVTKTLLSIQPALLQEYRACFPNEGSVADSKAEGFRSFEILGFDVLLDSNLKPWVIEVNHSPSLHCDTDLDHRIKYQVISESLVLASIDADDLIKGKAAKRALSLIEQKERMKQLLAKRYENSNATHAGAAKQNSSAPVNQKEHLEQRIGELRTAFEEGHCRGFSRILPYSPDSPYAEDYRRIESYKPALYQESPVTQRRREAIEVKRKQAEMQRKKQDAAVGKRPVWGSSASSSARKMLTNQNQETAADPALKPLEVPEEDSSRVPAPLPRVAMLKPYQRNYKRHATLEISPRQLREQYVQNQRIQQQQQQQQSMHRPTVKVQVQTLSFLPSPIGAEAKQAKIQPPQQKLHTGQQRRKGSLNSSSPRRQHTYSSPFDVETSFFGSAPFVSEPIRGFRPPMYK